MFVVADLFVVTLYGPQWGPSVLPLQILIIFALRQTVGSPTTVIFNVVGRPDVAFKMGLFFLPFYALSIWLGCHWGIVGVAAGVTIARTAYGMIQFAVIARLVGQTFRDLLAPMAQPLMAATIMGVLVFGCRLLLSSLGISGPVLLLALIPIGGLIWLVLLLRVFTRSLEEMLQVCDALSSPLGARVRRTIEPMMA
jgi:PST family polysaccharide transporter